MLNTNTYMASGSHRACRPRLWMATADFASHGRLDCTILRGRWSCSRTARLYIRQAEAQLGEIAYTQQQQHLFQSLHLIAFNFLDSIS